MRGDPAVERGARGAQLAALEDPAVAAPHRPPRSIREPGDRGSARNRRELGLIEVGQRRAQRAEHAKGVAGQAEQPARQHPQLAGLVVGAEPGGRRGLASLRFEVEQHAHDLRSGHAVHDRVVDLREHRDRSAIEPVNQVQLPEGAGPVQRTADDPRHLLGQLGVGAGRRQGQLAHVEVEIEVRVVEPVGVVEPEGHLHQPPPERRQQRQPFRDQVLDVGQLEPPARRGGWIQDRQPRHVARLPGRLEREELGVEAGQLAHATILPGADARRGAWKPCRAALPP